MEHKYTSVGEIITELKPKNIWEIGVGPPYLCLAINFVNSGIPIKLFEPHYENYSKLVEKYKELPNIDIYNIALNDIEGEMELTDEKECSSSINVVGPNAFNDPIAFKAKPTFKVPSLKLSRFDYGQIDILFLDVEGAEWNVISQMVSRPRVISIETHMKLPDGRMYINPNSQNLKKWLVDNKYGCFLQGDADSWFIKT